MEIHKLKDFIGGWFVGGFQPTVHYNFDFEVGYKSFKRGESHATHYHKVAKEINLIIEGTVKVQDHILHKDDIFVIKPYEVTEIEFLKDTKILVVKTPSRSGDKYIIPDPK